MTDRKEAVVDVSHQSSPEAVCFTAGPEGAAFGAGVIHAWLASDRPEPHVVAGVSTGAITAAAMQQSMLRRGRDERHRTEDGRWGWFQRYLTDILDRPLDVIWKALPDPVDFFSSTPPVRDLSCPDLLRDDERASRYHFWLLTKVGNWIGSLPIAIGDLGTLAILYVRWRERIPVSVLGRGLVAGVWRSGTLLSQVAWIGVQFARAIIAKPAFTRTYERFTADETGGLSSLLDFRPLFGWRAWLSVSGGAALAISALILELVLLVAGLKYLVAGRWTSATLALTAVSMVAVTAFARIHALLSSEPFADKLKKTADRINAGETCQISPDRAVPETLLMSALKSAQVNLKIISHYEMTRRFWNRFADAGNENPTVVCNDPDRTNLIIVASVLQSLKGTNHQCFAHSGTPLVAALSTACAIQPFFEPTHVSGEQLSHWFRDKDLKPFRDEDSGITQEFDLIDGAVIRKNPLPALFNWLQEESNHSVAKRLEAASRPLKPNIHVIYSVPIEPFDAYAGKTSPTRIDLVEAAQVGILMRARRDTNIEVKQTNFLSSIVSDLQESGKPDSKLLALFAGELAPEREVKFANPLSPTRDEGLKLAAEGCRRTLGRLYQSEIEAAIERTGQCSCSSLIREIAPCRSVRASPGLPEICGSCDGLLASYPTPPKVPSLVHQDYNREHSTQPSRTIEHSTEPSRPIEQAVPGLCQMESPKIVFVASGGVFRGAFHIGLVAAMQALNIIPDLVVGASVGTLMGAALAAIRNSPEPAAQLAILADLTDTFMRVDETVALTVPLKTAVKQLGLRSRNLRLSPAALKAAVKAGTSKDVGYASTGVPPIVIDTLSQLFIIPPSETLKAASDFLAGRFTKAAACLIELIRENTLESLEIKYAIIGTSMLERVATLLLGSKTFNLDKDQPYLDKNKGTAIFCTTAYVNQRWPLLLGRDALASGKQAFRFLYGALSSSAFPAAFPARQESEVFPGTGLVSNLFCDGGTFDNLPFIPAIEILSSAQKAYVQREHPDPTDFLAERLRQPHLIISGGFDPDPEQDHRPRFESRSDISARCTALAAEVKTASFIKMSRIVAEQLRTLNTLPPTPERDRIRTSSVVTGIVSVVPATDLHVNPTFGFARSVGFQPERVAASIADGCFQTLRNLQQNKSTAESETALSLEALKINVFPREPNAAISKGDCPYFQLTCPFVQAAESARNANNPLQSKACDGVYAACRRDAVHQKLHFLATLPKSAASLIDAVDTGTLRSLP